MRDAVPLATSPCPHHAPGRPVLRLRVDGASEDIAVAHQALFDVVEFIGERVLVAVQSLTGGQGEWYMTVHIAPTHTQGGPRAQTHTDPLLPIHTDSHTGFHTDSHTDAHRHDEVTLTPWTLCVDAGCVP